MIVDPEGYLKWSFFHVAIKSWSFLEYNFFYLSCPSLKPFIPKCAKLARKLKWRYKKLEWTTNVGQVIWFVEQFKGKRDDHDVYGPHPRCNREFNLGWRCSTLVVGLEHVCQIINWFVETIKIASNPWCLGEFMELSPLRIQRDFFKNIFLLYSRFYNTLKPRIE